MSDEGKEIKPTKKFGSIQQQRETIAQWQTVGGKKESTDMPQSTLAEKRNDVIASKHQDASEMKRQTVYMPTQLAKRLKVHAAETGDDISGIITRLVQEYLDRVS